MKPVISIIIMTFLWFTLFSCNKDENTPGSALADSFTESAALNELQTETWRVSLYIDCDEDETYHFSGYSFSFDSTGVVTAVNSSSTVTGSWSKRTDDGHNKFDLNFGKNDPFHKLNEDWHIIEQTSVKIRLEDVGKKSGETEFLTFEKN
jgi:hypothetical protein